MMTKSEASGLSMHGKGPTARLKEEQSQSTGDGG